ncbi:MAG: cbb3-type cytochrome c oxidase N-terminal domain-containing protein [Candidatus Krumholzibacteriia bacterium]
MSEQNRPEADHVRDHAFDGIQEYDNKLPNWWLWILYGSILFALGYWLVIQTIGAGDLPRQALQKQMVAAAEAQLARAAAGGVTNESLQLMTTIPAKVEEGRALFEQYCAVCHQTDGSGLVGPNLTDDYWIHGPTGLDHLNVITNGVTAKGMAAWGNQLGPARVELLAAYVLTLQGKHRPGKAPEGEFYGGETTP